MTEVRLDAADSHGGVGAVTIPEALAQRRDLGDVDGWFGKADEVRLTIEAGQQLDPRIGKMPPLVLA